MNTQTQKKVCIIDPDDAIRDSIQTLFKIQNIKVYGFRDAQSFLSTFQGSFSGCIVIEKQLPDLNGFDLVKTLKVMGNESPIILITSKTDPALANEAIKTGVSKVLIKPLLDQDLLGEVCSALDMKSSRLSK